ncbi:MAG: hydrolase 2, exosortase A system-associated [Burkholderiales bacterium]
MQGRAFFVPASNAALGQRFCLFYPAVGAPRGKVLYVHPFAEEMNKSRRMAALSARALARAGFAVLQIDLLGCGDSFGDSGDARWSDWLDDVALAGRWLQTEAAGPLWLWGLRAGCLLASQAAARIDEPCHFLFWQPPPSGKPLVQQFLRLKAAGDLLSGDAKGVMQALRQQIEGGQPVEIAGYTLQSELIRGFESAALTPPVGAPAGMRVAWLEVSNQSDPSLTPASVLAAERWSAAGFDVDSQVIAGPAFWQTTEIEAAPLLIEATVAALLEASTAGARAP